MHVLEAGDHKDPTIVLLHGFPELAYSWRKLMLPLANAGFHVVAPDQRGYGRTAGWKAGYKEDQTPFIFTNLVKDIVALVYALGKTDVHTIVGHDFGSPIAAWCALIRPDVFRQVVLMSAPFAGPPAINRSNSRLHEELFQLTPSRMHYQWYYGTPEANEHMLTCEEGLQQFLRAYYHVKSADWAGNNPEPLESWSADELAKLPTYYVMETGKTMPETVRPFMPDSTPAWLTNAELEVYTSEYQRTGFQGGLNWYRSSASTAGQDALALFTHKSIEVPAWFIAGKSDWGIYQSPGSLDRMQSSVCSNFRGLHLVEGAGHWVQQEKPEEVMESMREALT